MTINPSDQFGTSQLRKHLGDNPAEVIRSAESLSQLPSSIQQSFELLGEVLTEARDRLREEVIEALGKMFLPWLDKNPKTLAEVPFIHEITPLSSSTITECEIEFLKLEDRCFDPRVPASIRFATLRFLDCCDGGNRFETESIRIEAEIKRAEELHRKRHPPKAPIPRIRFSGLSVKQDLLFFESFRTEKVGERIKLIVPAAKSEALIGVFNTSKELYEWVDRFTLFKAWAGDKFRKTETSQLQSTINSFESMLSQQDCQDKISQPETLEHFEEPSSPAPQKFIDPLMPSSDKYDMPEFDHQK